MLKKIIKYLDFNGVERSEELYFHVSKASVLTSPDNVYNEIIKLATELQERSKFMQDIEEETDSMDPLSKKGQLLADSVRMVARLLDRLVDFSYGKKSDDGSRFVKGEEVINEFKNSAVYDAFVEQLISNPDEMVEFINQLLSTK